MGKKAISITIISVCAAFVCVAGIFFVKNANLKKAKELNIAFYKVEEKTQEYISSMIKGEFDGKINVKIFDSLDIDEKNIRKYDLLFTWECSESQKLEGFAKEVPSKALGFLPNSLKMQSKKSLPLLVNPYVLDFYKPAAELEKLNFPSTFEEFEKYLYEVSGQVFSPFFCSGGDDKTLISLVGSIIQAKEGVDGYKKYVESVKNGSAMENDSVLTVLDMFKSWAKKGLVHPMWFMANENDVAFFSEEKQIGVTYTNLNSHRKIKYNVIKDFEMIKFPDFELSANEEHGIVSDKLVCMSFTPSLKSKPIMIKLVSDTVQSNLSIVSMLGPVALRGESFDIQADDARFYVAACAGGSLITESFGNIAQEFRDYLKK